MNLCFNELSLLKQTTNQSEGVVRFETFIKTYSKAISENVGFSREIITTIDLNSIEISEGFFSAKWRNSKKYDRDLQIRYKRMCDLQKIQTCTEKDSEVTFCKEIGNGLKLAYENDMTMISILNDSCWNEYHIKCEYYTFDTDEVVSIDICNISSIDGIYKNINEIRKQIKSEFLSYTNTKELTENINTIFPNLIFHKVALDQINNQLEVQHLQTVIRKLQRLEDYFKTWDGKEFNRDLFPNKSISPESPDTLKRFKEEHTFAYDDICVLVSLHMRYTGNIPGRIYFYPDSDQKKGRICSVTTKLPTVSNPKLRL